MFKRLIKQVKGLRPPNMLFVNRQNGYDFDLPDNIIVFSRGGFSPVSRGGAVHHRHLLNLNLGAPCVLLLNGQRILLESGSCFLVYPYENHLFLHSDKKIFRLMITFEVKRNDTLPPPRSSVMLSGDMKKIITQMLELYNRENFSRWELTLLLTLFLSKFKDACADTSITGNIKDASSLTAGVVKYILSHIDREMSLDEIAARFNVSVSSLRRKFLSDTGDSIGEYIRRSRVMKAMYYLTRNENNISEIAELCGYGSIQAFSRAFKEKSGMTPLAFRGERLRKKHHHHE